MESDKPLLTVPVQVVGFQPKVDRSWTMKFETRELNGEEVALLADSYQGEGWLVFSPNTEGIKPEEIPTEAAEAGVKSPGQRLRAKVFVYWKQHVNKGDFESYWRTYVQKQIERIDEEIDN